jgi:hypothetical protein
LHLAAGAYWFNAQMQKFSDCKLIHSPQSFGPGLQQVFFLILDAAAYAIAPVLGGAHQSHLDDSSKKYWQGHADIVIWYIRLF